MSESISANINENLNDPVEKVSNNVNSNSVIPRLPDIKIDVPIEKVSLKVSESISDKYSDKNPVEKVSLQDNESMSNEYNDSESVVDEYNDATLNENFNDPVEKVSNNVNSNSVIPRLPDIKIAVPMKKVSWKVSESINDRYSDKDINSDRDIPKLPKNQGGNNDGS